jgi:hypothetical protein
VKTFIKTSKFTVTLALTVLFFLTSGISAQESPLTLGEVMTALQSKSSNWNLEKKNNYLIQRVGERGVTFKSSVVVIEELKRAGASSALLTVIRTNGPGSNQTSTTNSTNAKPDIKFTKLWVEQNIRKNGRNGIAIHAQYTAYNLKEKPMVLLVRFQGADGKNLKTENSRFANKLGELALFRNFKPGFDAAVYKDWDVFIPYAEIPLSSGRNRLKIDADVFYSKGARLKHLTFQNVVINKPKPSLSKADATFGKMWVDYDVKEGGRKGMRIHVRLRVKNLKDTLCYVAIKFEQQDGRKLKTTNTLFADSKGDVTLLSELNPGSATVFYDDISAFMPYSELRLKKGAHKLKMHADLTYTDFGLIKHLGYNNFRITQP